MILILTVVHVLVCIALVFTVLLQKGAGSDMGSAFGGGGTSQSIFGAQGTGSFLGKVTAGLATAFMLTSLTLAFVSTQKTGRSSVMEGLKPTAPITAPASGETAASGDEPAPPPKSGVLPLAGAVKESGAASTESPKSKPVPLPDEAEPAPAAKP
ncbi:MAG: preprotein translocase subunit SecG [Magnetococcales bacterium]|nr:preprotein translocase subunit SecG [Magnetococcales bacterium]